MHISMDDNSSRRESQILPNESEIMSQMNNMIVTPGGETEAPGSTDGDRDQTDAGATGSSEVNGSADDSIAGSSTASSSSENSRNRNENSEGLPTGWTLQVAPNGRVFFINHSDKKTTWVDPRTGRPSPLPSHNNVPNRRHEDDLGPLPEGWEERVHTDGRIFFIDHNTRQTQVNLDWLMASLVFPHLTLPFAVGRSQNIEPDGRWSSHTL